MACNIIPKAANGQPSFLYESMINSGLTRDEALEIYYIVHQDDFKKFFGDWEKTNLGDMVDHNGEPRLEYIMSTENRIKDSQKYHNIFLDENMEFDMPSFIKLEEGSPKYIKLVSDYKFRLDRANEQLSYARRTKNKRMELEVEKRVRLLEEDLDNIEKARKLEDIQQYAEKDLTQVEEVLQKKNISLKEIGFAKQKLHTWQKGIDLFFDEEERVDSSLIDDFKNYEIRARNLEDKIIKVEDAYIVKMIKDSLDEDVSIEELMKMKKDVSRMYAETQDISKIDDLVLQAIHRLVKNKNSITNEEIKNVIKTTDKLSKDIKTKYGKNVWNKFLQQDKHGNYTGSIVSKWSSTFLETKRNLQRTAFGKNSSPSKIKKYYEWKRENEIIMDPNLIFSEDQEKRNAHLSEIEKHIGKTELDRRVNMLQKKIENYHNDAEAIKDGLYAEFGEEEGELLFKSWQVDNSPYYYANRVKSNKKPVKKRDGSYPKNNGAQYLYEIPRKFYKDGKETEWHDKKFSEIESDPKLLEFYNHYMDIMKEMTAVLPADQLENMRINSIPGIKKTVLDLFEKEGMKAGLTGIWGSIKESLTVGNLGEFGTQYVDPITGETPKTMRIDGIENIDNKISTLVKEKVIQFNLENSRDPNGEELRKITQEARDEVTSNTITDLGRILKAYSALSITYKHKTEIEDYLQLSRSIINRQVELETNNAGQAIIDPNTGETRGKTIQDSYKNKKAALDYFIRVQYGDGKSIEGVTNKTIYTPEEKSRLYELNKMLDDNQAAYDQEKIDEGTYNNNKEFINSEIEKLGSKFNLGKLGDQVLNWTRLKGMGWNPMSAVSNMLFGMVANVIEGSDGRVYSMKSFWKAYALTLNSTAKSLTFGTVATPAAKKIRALMDKFDVLKEGSQELYHTRRHEWEGKMKNLHPFNLQKITEYMNQAPIMIAIMMDEKITVNGKKLSLWEAFNNNGELEGYEVGSKEFNKIKAKIDQIIKQNHGNYDPDSALLMKEKLWKRALGQFRTFMLEGFEARFGNERYDSNLGISRKGRYRSYISFYKNKGAISGTLHLSKQFLRKLTFQKTQFDQMISEDGFTEVDAANMRKNLTGLLVLASVSIMYFMGKASVEDDEDKLAIYNWYTNQLLRVKTDMMFYANPSAFEQLTKNSIPAMTTISDTEQLFEAIFKFMIGEDEIKGGVHSGDSRLMRETMQWLPGTRGIYSWYNATQQVYDK